MSTAYTLPPGETACASGASETPEPAPMSATMLPGFSLSLASVSSIFRLSMRCGLSRVLIHSSALREASCADAGTARHVATPNDRKNTRDLRRRIGSSLFFLCVLCGSRTRSAQQVFTDFAVHIGQPEVAARVAIGQLRVIHAELIEHRRVQVVDRHAVLHGLETELV